MGFRLKSDNDFVLFVDVTGRVRCNGTRNLRDIEHALFTLLDKHCFQLLPYLLRALGGWREEFSVAIVWCVIALKEPADVDIALPEAGLESPICFRLSHGF